MGSYELLMVIIRSAQAPAGSEAGPGASGVPGDDLLQAQAAGAFAGEVAAGQAPSARATVLGCTLGSRVRSRYART